MYESGELVMAEIEKDKNEEEIKKFLQLIRTVDYGSVTVIIQAGKIVQIEKNEKIRLK